MEEVIDFQVPKQWLQVEEGEFSYKLLLTEETALTLICELADECMHRLRQREKQANGT